MAFLAKSGNPEEEEALAVCITSCVPRSELPGGPNNVLFVIEKLAEILRKSKGLYRIEIDINADRVFTLYTYSEQLDEDKNKKEG